jgi:alcohol dehydrogenase class IV
MKHLKPAYDDGKDEEARKNMMYGACQAGIAMASSNLGLGHSTGHALGGIYHTPHGRAVGLFLPYVMEYSVRGSEEALHRYAEMARFCNIARDNDDRKCFEALIAAVRRLAKSMGQPLSVKELGIGRDDYFKHLEGLVDRAINDAVTLGAPRPPEVEDLAKIFTGAYDGKPVDF